MRVSGFLHSGEQASSTLGQIEMLYKSVKPEHMLCCFAYATPSGTRSFEISLGGKVWRSVSSRWLFSIDYGRTDPRALRYMEKKANAEVRIHDGSYVVRQSSFTPRRIFHMKAAFLINNGKGRYGFIAGSGNFSACGLLRNVECGLSLYSSKDDHGKQEVLANYDSANSLWEEATPLGDIIEVYEMKYREQRRREIPPTDGPGPAPENYDRFWIEAGYVTRNRGRNRPGNQIDMPRNMHRFFGLPTPAAIAKNTRIGQVIVTTPNGGEFQENLRFGDNSMEKITLPFPEENGFDVYDGKVIVFEKRGRRFGISVFEPDDFEMSFYGRLSDVRSMRSGRRYGAVA